MSQIFFGRNDIIQGTATSRGCLKVLPLGKSKTQKVVLGDFNGVVQSFSYKKGELIHSFKTMPTGISIDAVELGLGNGQKDKIFTTSNQTLKGSNKKGKDFFKFKTNLTEKINWFKVYDLQVWLCSDFTFNHYVDSKDKNFFRCNDKINDMLAVPIVGDHAHNAVLACNDQMVRVLQGSDVYYEAAVDGPVRSIYNKLSKPGTQKEILYSTTGGLVGQMFMDSEVVRRGWKLPSESKVSTVECMEATVDFTKDGMLDLTLGRDDGSVEVYTLMDDGSAPRKVFEKTVNESITAIGTGFVTDSTVEDIVLSTYSGKVISLSPARADGTSIGTGEEKAAGGKVMKKLLSDVDHLQSLVEAARERYTKVSEDLVAVDTRTFYVNDKFVLDPRDGTYVMSIESPMPIFTIAIQSDVPVELLETDSNVAILSQSPVDPENGNFCLATYRCQEASNRIEVKMRAVEGHYGTVQAFVVPRVAPKTCQICSYRIRPLCLQHRVQKVDEKRPLNELKITGSFTVAEVHAWVVFCLPDIPARAPQDEVSYCFQSVLMETILTAKYKAGEGIFRSDSVTTLAILREGITKEATAKKIRINIAFDLKDDSVGHFIRLLHPKLVYQLGLSRKIQLIEALKEVRMQEEDISFLDPTYKEVLDTADEVEREFKRQPRQLEYLHGIVKDLFIDFHKFKGTNVKHRVGQLEQVLRNYDVESLIQFILRSQQ